MNRQPTHLCTPALRIPADKLEREARESTYMHDCTLNAFNLMALDLQMGLSCEFVPT